MNRAGFQALLQATPGVDAPPPALPPRPIAVPEMPQFALRNGLQVVVATRRDVPLVTALLLARHGPEAEPGGRAGLAGMTATVQAKGALRHGRAQGATEIARTAEALGATLDAGSTWRSSTLGMTVTTPRLGEALALLADVARAPVLAADELERARSQALDGLRVALADPGSVAGMVARRMFWGDAVYGASATPASLQRLVRADLQAFHRHTWQPGAAVLILAGDITPDAARTLAERHFGHWLAVAEAPQAPGRAEPAPATPPLAVVDMPGSGQAGVVVTAPYVPLGSPERRAALVAAAVLGGGYSARLNQEVRIKRGLSYGASGGGESQPAAGMFVAQAQTKPESAMQVVQLLREEITRLAQALPTAEELAARQATLLGGFARRLETTGGLAQMVAGQLAAGRALAELKNTVDEVMAVTPAQVGEFAARHWRPEALRATVVVDAKAAGPELQADAAALRLTLAELDLERASLVKKG